MNFITFPVSSTNIFPAANATSGAQLLTEWNLRAREMVDTDSAIRYDIGHSYVHSMDDFDVHILKNDAGVAVNSYTLEVSEGKGIINGHFVQALAPMTIDLVEANTTLQSRAMNPLKGELTIGIRAFYATEETVAGTMLTENEDEMYVGIQLVVLPSDEFITPEESPADISKITAHLRLATFQFNNNRISYINNKTDKIQYIDAERLRNASQLIAEGYIRKDGLNPKRIYTFAGKGTDPSTGLDTWTDSTDSLMIWDANPQRTTSKPTYTEAQFTTDNNRAYLVAPHLQIQGMTTESGEREYYAPKVIPVPVADYDSNTPGIVNKEYTSHIKEIGQKVNEFRTTLKGKQVYYYDQITEDTVLPPINPNWNIGDYILVGTDGTLDENSDGIKPPATMYVILPGIIESIVYSTQVDGSDEIPSTIKGARLGILNWAQEDGYQEPDITNPEDYPEFFKEDDKIRGVPGEDYFQVRYVRTDETFTNYYYVVDKAGKREWSLPVYVTGEIPLATENSIGGFLNVSPDNADYGYVYMDDYGRLRLVDYALLRSGTLAYQLGEDLTVPAGITTAEIQTYMTEYVNQRVAFGNAKQLASGNTNSIHIYITLAEEETDTTLTIGDIDSRFNTSVCLHILGNATSTTTINIHDCQKLRIDNDIQGSPIINVYRTCLYYDPLVFNYIRNCTRPTDSADTGVVFTGMEDITLWYEMMDDTDPNLTVNYMTVSEIDAPITPEEVSYWSPVGAESNDNYYLTALKSITFSGSGDIVGCSMLVANQSTDNVDPGDKVVLADFELPQGAGLTYPKACMTKQLKVTGTFVSAYLSNTDWYITDTSFSALTQAYDKYDMTTTTKGNIAFHSHTVLVESQVSETSIPVWESDTYHIFYGGVIS